MAIKTTINIHIAILAKINYASIILCKSRMEIIKILLGKYSIHNPTVIMFTPVKYQTLDDPENCHTFHLYLREDEYENCLDFRKLYKKSLSLIISESVTNYLPNMIRLAKKHIHIQKEYNHIINYIFSRRIINGIICDTAFRGLPDPDTLLRYIT